ncbi:MAG: EamA/RhaT family transporter [Rhodovulum sulfidophilum]|uniref:EamA/RhaT family transporter n=1 Tax=Rhodovulum sulfidophilum TaxID=35806 RepID=A0A2W5NGD7_RHOSU|nr:MAG: EamA/RhaT family transporter [Rhodovulum sulfidophilum]
MHAAIAEPRADNRLHGILLVGAATLMWSTAGLFTRGIDLDLWTLVGWRSLFACLTLLAYAAHRDGRAAFDLGRRLGWRGLVYVPAAAVSMLGYIAALRLTTVANVMTIYATMPFVCAGIAWLLMRERVTRDVVIASGVAFAGVVFMAGSATAPGDVAGNALALLMTAAFAGTVVMARHWRGFDVTLGTACAAGLCALVCGLLAERGVPSPAELGLLFLFSLCTQSLSYLLFLAGGRQIPGAESGLIALLDVVLAPLWVWIAFAETPGTPALVGGALTLSAVTWYMARQLARRPRGDR